MYRSGKKYCALALKEKGISVGSQREKSLQGRGNAVHEEKLRKIFTIFYIVCDNHFLIDTTKMKSLLSVDTSITSCKKNEKNLISIDFFLMKMTLF